MARWVSIESMKLRFVKSHSVSRMRIRGSPIEVTRSRVSSSDLPTLTTTSSHTSRTDWIAATMGKSSLTALRTMVKPDSISGPELQVVEAPVETVGGEQAVVAAALHDPPFGQHQDGVGVLHRRQAMRDDQHRPVGHEAI